MLQNIMGVGGEGKDNSLRVLRLGEGGLSISRPRAPQRDAPGAAVRVQRTLPRSNDAPR